MDSKQIFGTGEFFTRQRPIYYDTDQIVEKQHEQISAPSALVGE